MSDRVRQLTEELSLKMMVTRESLAAELDRAIELAHELQQPAAVVSGIQAKARLLGLEAPSKSVNVNVNTTFSEMSDTELHYELASMVNEVRAAAGMSLLALPLNPRDQKH